MPEQQKGRIRCSPRSLRDRSFSRAAARGNWASGGKCSREKTRMVSGRRRGARASAYQTEPLDPAIIVERIVALQDVENRVRRIEGIVGVFVGLGATSLAAPDFRGAFVTFVTSLGSPEVTLRKPIPVTIVPDGDEFTASFMDANISSGGGSPQEALYNLQHLIAAFFLLDEEEPTELLSGRMRHQRQVLAECVCRISRETMPNE